MSTEKPAHPSTWFVVRNSLCCKNFYFIRVDIYSCTCLAESHSPKINSQSPVDLAICMNYVVANVTSPLTALPNDQTSCFLCEMKDGAGVGKQGEGIHERRRCSDEY